MQIAKRSKLSTFLIPLKARLNRTTRKAQKMRRKHASFATLVFLGLGIPLVFGQAPGMQMPAANHSDQSRKSLDAQMMGHQKEMQTLLTNLQKSFQAVVDAKGANGYVRDKAILKAHEADITAFQNAVRDHKLFVIDYEHKCGVNSRQHDMMIQHQQQMKSVLYDVVDSYSTYLSANDRSIEVSEPAEDALNAHREALKELSSAIAQHEHAKAQMMKTCAWSGGQNFRDMESSRHSHLSFQPCPKRRGSLPYVRAVSNS